MTTEFRPTGWDHASRMTADEWKIVEDAARGLSGGHMSDYPSLRQILKELGFYTAPGVTALLTSSMAKTVLEYRERDKQEKP